MFTVDKKEIVVTVEYQYDSESKVIHVHPSECLSLKSIQEYFRKILADNNIEPGFVEVVHFDEVKDFDYSSDEALLVGDLVRELVDKKQDKGAVFVVKTELQYGMARMLSIMAGDFFPISIVRTENEVQTEIDKLLG